MQQRLWRLIACSECLGLSRLSVFYVFVLWKHVEAASVSASSACTDLCRTLSESILI